MSQRVPYLDNYLFNVRNEVEKRKLSHPSESVELDRRLSRVEIEVSEWKRVRQEQPYMCSYNAIFEDE